MPNEEKRLCPLNRMKPCLPACAWHNGQECSAFMLAQEAFEVVEALRAFGAPEIRLDIPEAGEQQEVM